MIERLDDIPVPFTLETSGWSADQLIWTVEMIAFNHGMNLDNVRIVAPMQIVARVLRIPHVRVERYEGRNHAIVQLAGGNLTVTSAYDKRTFAQVFHEGNRVGEFTNLLS